MPVNQKQSGILQQTFLILLGGLFLPSECVTGLLIAAGRSHSWKHLFIHKLLMFCIVIFCCLFPVGPVTDQHRPIPQLVNVSWLVVKQEETPGHI